MIYATLAEVWRHLNGRGIARHKRRLRRARRNTRDHVEISPEATYRFAAREFDPRRITFTEATALTNLLFETGAVGRQDRRAMLRSIDALPTPPIDGISQDRPINLIEMLETRLALDNAIRHAEFARTLAILRLVDCRRR